MLIAALASAIPARGQPWIAVRRGRRRASEPEPASSNPTVERLPAAGALEYARADGKPGD
jgi:hypothetical protein